MSDTELRKKLTSEQYHVTRENGTEPPFHNAYWDNHKPGIYVDLISGEALFASTDKFESGTGWPSFTKPIDPAHVVTKTDQTLFMERTEVRSKESNAHLGHVFDDGPAADRHAVLHQFRGAAFRATSKRCKRKATADISISSRRRRRNSSRGLAARPCRRVPHVLEFG